MRAHVAVQRSSGEPRGGEYGERSETQVVGGLAEDSRRGVVLVVRSYPLWLDDLLDGRDALHVDSWADLHVDSWAAKLQLCAGACTV